MNIADYLRGYVRPLDEQPSSRVPEELQARYPRDTSTAALVPAGVRLEVSGTARRIAVKYSLGEPNELASPSAADAFSIWCGDSPVEQIELPGASRGGAEIVLPLPERHPASIVTVYLPERAGVRIQSLSAHQGDARPAPRGARWIAYGDSITQGWTVPDPGLAWASRVARRTGLDLVNLAFAGSARGETITAMQVADSEPGIVTIAWGTNAWSMIPTDRGLVREQMRVFISMIRRTNPAVPIVVLSPVLRPQAENAQNRLGATLADIRGAIEDSVERLRSDGDPALRLIRGADIVPEDELVDGIHPGSTGHDRIAQAFEAELESFPVAAKASGDVR